MITIVNIDPLPRRKGRHLYSMRNNQDEVCQFYHNREDKLSECLRRAWEAVFIHEVQEADK